MALRMLCVTQGFNAINGTEVAGALDTGLTYYQVWNSTDWTFNEGSQGLQRLDRVISTAGKYGIKVILAFTNNWYVMP
jgi:mannan endo-1,4-beta-mannosidase